PNPCVWCNEDIKFTMLYQKANQDLSINNVATGHYANIETINDYQYIKRGKDAKKDQSYFLYRVPPDILKHTIFPVGNMTKTQVKKLADKYLPDFHFHQKKESQDLCFYPEDSYQSFIGKYARQLTKPGIIVNEKGERVGEHSGLVNYTVGQRQGLRIGGGEIYYVKRIDTEQNKLIVSQRSHILCDNIKLIHPILTPVLLQKRSNIFQVQIRYGHNPANCQVNISRDYKNITLKFEKAQFAATPGQHAVIYQKNIVIGGGEIR
ncbi:MAG: tRNA 2-thiouridine(34) synthase MnmA, partial [Patescibacteria group bacterium]